MAIQEESKHGCFSNFFKVLLCAGNGTSPPVYPSDHVEETKQVNSEKDKVFGDVAICTPGVVARLMGLDSLPTTNLVVKNRSNPDSVPRSRSVNFVDYLLEFDLSHASHHRRVKTSASFREVPSLVPQKQNHPFVLEVDDYNKHKVDEDGANLREMEKSFGEMKHRKREGGVRVKKERNQGKSKKISKLKNEPRRVPSSSKVRNHSSEAKDLCKSCGCRYSYVGSSTSSCSPLPNRDKKGFVEPKMRNNMKKSKVGPKKMPKEHSLENLSPVSVLDINDYAFLDGADFLGTSTLASKSKWESSLPGVSSEDDVEVKAGKNNGYYPYIDVNKEAEYYSELMVKIRTLAEKDVRESDYTANGICGTESFEEICLLFAHKILDLLLVEVVHEVVELSS